MADLPHHLRSCFQSGKLALLAVLVSGGIVLQILSSLHCQNSQAVKVLMYVLLPMPLLFFAGSNASSLYTESSSGWIDATKFMTGASIVGSIAIPVILKHAGVIGWGALAMELSSFFIFGMAILCFLGTSDNDAYSPRPAGARILELGVHLYFSKVTYSLLQNNGGRGREGGGAKFAWMALVVVHPPTTQSSEN
ncbi:hypothetical protein SASPL_153309 [Salvia splendens]|uniref:Vacuolar protein sorting-associated protein 55 n=1 Tax=Salvia splendens TaxID=180675 RepID=A0A8X8W5Q8_SALSN|nr:hypothetical protein SASPL_153309 [Salvia splendens]